MATETPSIPELVIGAFGGLVKTQKALGHKNASTVFGWKKKGQIPHWRRAEIIAAAERENVKLPAAYLKDRAA